MEITNGITDQPTVTELNHVALAIAAMALTHYAFARPLMTTGPNGKLFWMWLATLIWAFVFPLIMIFSDAYSGTLTGEAFFVIIKIISVAVGVLTMQSFISYFHVKGHVSVFALTWVMNMIVVANISEAVMTQFKNYLEPEDPTQDPNIVDLINAGIGAGLNCVLLWQSVAGPGMRVIKSGENNIRLASDYRPWFIISYTAWNMLFRSRLIENTSWLVFFTVSLLLPLIEHFNGEGDWLQIRGIGLLAYLVYGLGLTPGEGRLFPVYNTDGYYKAGDDASFISAFQRNDVYRWGLIVVGGITLGLSLWECRVQSRTFLGVFTTTRHEVPDKLGLPSLPHLHTPAPGIQVGKQIRMNRRGTAPAWQVNLEILGGASLLLGVTLYCVFGSMIEPRDWTFGVVLGVLFVAALLFSTAARLFPLVAHVFVLLSLVIVIPYSEAFRTMSTGFEYVALYSVYFVAFLISILRIDNVLRQNKAEEVGYYEIGTSNPWSRFARWLGDDMFPSNNIMDSAGYSWALFGVVAFSILVESVQDVINGNYLNAAAGAYLVAAMPRAAMHKYDPKVAFFAPIRKSWNHILFIDNSHTGFYDLVYETRWPWVLLFISTRLAFAYDESRSHFGSLLVIFAASLFTEAPRSFVKLDPHLFIQNYSYVILFQSIVLAFYDPFETYADTSDWFNENAVTAWGAANCGFVLLHMIYKGVNYKDGSDQRRTSMGSRASRESLDNATGKRISVASISAQEERRASRRRSSVELEQGNAATGKVDPGL